MQVTALGERIKNFRVTKGISQFELEVAIDASSGVLSRIESGKINPTKETIWKIAKALKLSLEDEMRLLGVEESDPTTEEVANVRAELKDYFAKPEVFALLLDNHDDVVLGSEGFYRFLPYPREALNQLIGKNLLEILFMPEFGISEMIKNPESIHLYDMVLFRQKFGHRINDTWAKELIGKLSKFAEFRKYWDLSDKYLNKHFTKEARKILVSNGEKTITLMAYFQLLNSDPRFEIIEYEVLT